MKSFDTHSPKNLIELLQCINKADEENKSIKFLAGGTDLIIALREGKVVPDTVIDISRVQELQGIEEEDGFIRIGAASTFTEIHSNQLIRGNALCLAQAASEVGSEQIRNTGTVGGNIANASPAADSLPPLVALDATVIVINAKGEKREFPVGEISAGVGKSTLKDDEVIVEIKIPTAGEAYRSAFCKLGRRKALAIARINLAVALEYEEIEGIIKDSRVALGAVGTFAFRSKKAQEILNGNKPSLELAERFAETVSQEVAESIPTRSSMPYKKTAVKGLAYDAFIELFNKSLNPQEGTITK